MAGSTGAGSGFIARRMNDVGATEKENGEEKGE
jgi:hypothetical protein